MHKLTFSLLATTALLGGCSWLEPDFELPTFGNTPATLDESTTGFVSPTVVGSWQVVEPAQLTPASATTPWYTVLNIPGLDELMKQALADNPNLKLMAARVQQARAEAGIALASQLPNITASGGVTRGRNSPAQNGLAEGSSVKESTLYNAGMSASFELDLFGRLNSQSRVSRLLARSQSDLYDDFKLVLEGEVARTALQTRTTHDVLESWKALLADAEQRHALLEARYKAGELSVEDFQSSLAALQSLRAGALQASTNYQQAQNALAVLLGQVPQNYTVPGTLLTATLAPVPGVPQGISSSLLLRRPDVRAAAHQLQAANASIGAARAAFFPRIALTGDGGFATGDFSNLFNWNNRTWAAGPVVSLPIFQGGALRANLRRSWAVYEQNVEAYRGQLLAAFRGVSDGLTGATNSRQASTGLTQALEASRTAEKAAQARYNLGDIGKLELLTARISTRQAEIQQAEAQQTSYTALIRLLQELGGTW